jgi:integrase
MSLSLPIYKRGNIFVLHLRLGGKQIKRSLCTHDPAIARVRGIELLSELIQNVSPRARSNTHSPQAVIPAGHSGSSLGTSPTQALEEAVPDPAVTHAMPESGAWTTHAEATPPAPMLPPAGLERNNNEQQQLLRQAHQIPTVFVPRTALPNQDKFKMAVVFSTYTAVKKIREVTKIDYASYAKDIVPFFKNRDIRTLTEQDVSDLILHLRVEQGNDPRTVDNKVGFLRAVINHLIKHGQFAAANPAAAKNLVSKRERRQSGTKPIAYNDLKPIFGSEAFAKLRQTKPSIYLIVMTGLCTGMRVSSIAKLAAMDLKESMHGTAYIDISADKTVAGNRDIPIPRVLFDALKSHLSQGNGFGLVSRGEKGYSDAVNKPIKAFLKESHFDGRYDKLSFHAFRKSFNNHMLSLGVERHICGALLGHVDESMTTGIYALPPSVDMLEQRVGTLQQEILNYLGFKW